MSMLSAQIDELRNAARGQKAMGLFELAQMLNDAADTIWQLRDDLQRANAENAKLRNDAELLRRMLQAKRQETHALMSENAKLRDSLKALMMGTNVELCADRDEPDCKECSMHHGKDGCTVVDAMELLGIDMYGEPLEVKS